MHWLRNAFASDELAVTDLILHEHARHRAADSKLQRLFGGAIDVVPFLPQYEGGALPEMLVTAITNTETPAAGMFRDEVRIYDVIRFAWPHERETIPPGAATLATLVAHLRKAQHEDAAKTLMVKGSTGELVDLVERNEPGAVSYQIEPNETTTVVSLIVETIYKASLNALTRRPLNL